MGKTTGGVPAPRELLLSAINSNGERPDLALEIIIVMSIAKHHAAWVSLIEVSGPFLSLPALGKRFRK